MRPLSGPSPFRATSGIDALSVHAVLADEVQPQIAAAVVERAAAVLKEKFGIGHSTLQVEYVGRKEQEVSL